MFREVGKHKERAAMTLEFMILTSLILIAMLFFSKYILRGIMGNWKKVGEVFSYGRVYDPQYTNICAWYEVNQIWYDIEIYEDNCDCWSVRQTATTCDICIRTIAATPQCNDQ